MTTHKGLPVAGYKPQSDDKVALVNRFKEFEERLLRELDAAKAAGSHDPRWLAIAQTHFQEGFMAAQSLGVPARPYPPARRRKARGRLIHILIAFLVITAVVFFPLWFLNGFAHAMGNKASAGVFIGSAAAALAVGAIGALIFGGLWAIIAPLFGA